MDWDRNWGVMANFLCFLFPPPRERIGKLDAPFDDAMVAAMTITAAALCSSPEQQLSYIVRVLSSICVREHTDLSTDRC
jgi:hypothetical protein